MGSQTKTVGGSPTSPLAKEFTNWLMGGLTTGNYGQAGAGGVLTDILSGGAGKIGGSLSTLLQNQQMRDTDALRARYSSGAGAYGSGAQYAEGLYKAQAAPQITSAIGNLQLQALNPIMQQMGGLTALGTPQATTITQPSVFSQILGGGAGLLGALAPFLTKILGGNQNTPPGTGGIPGVSGNLPPSNLPGFTPPNLGPATGSSVASMLPMMSMMTGAGGYSPTTPGPAGMPGMTDSSGVDFNSMLPMLQMLGMG